MFGGIKTTIEHSTLRDFCENKEFRYIRIKVM